MAALEIYKDECNCDYIRVKRGVLHLKQIAQPSCTRRKCS